MLKENYHLEFNKSLDDTSIIATLLRDVQTKHSEVYSPRAMRLDLEKIEKRMSREGKSFLTKTLPRLAKAFDRALTGEVSFDSTGFRKESGSQLPKLFGGLFKCVFTHDGWVLPIPCVLSIETIRQVFGLLYKLKLPYAQDDEQRVIQKFIETDEQLADISEKLANLAASVSCDTPLSRQSFDGHKFGSVITMARRRLARLFASFDPRDIEPSHGPGAVSGKEQLWDKWTFKTVSPRITESYPLDEYFYASLGHVCDDIHGITTMDSTESSARVILVPKDSRGPRLISAEPLEFQYVQQGLSRAIVKHVERHPLTRGRVNFTAQEPNREAALKGSASGLLATLDLNEASDRVSLGLVRLLFPEPLLGYLLNCRSLSTELPGGRVITLNKFAPMGSANCFPVLALAVWAILDAGAPDADTRKSILVYGDDVIVPTAYAANAIELLESFGLKVNRDKSCTSGFFRESCGMDAFAGYPVTPIRLRTVWSSHRCPHVYASYIAYANAFYRKGYFGMYGLITRALISVYGEIPEQEHPNDTLALIEVPEKFRPKTFRTHAGLQKRQVKRWAIEPITVHQEIDGWKMLLRYFIEGGRSSSPDREQSTSRRCEHLTYAVAQLARPAFSVRKYTKRRAIKLVRRWHDTQSRGSFLLNN